VKEKKGKKMHIISEILPNPTVNETVYNYSVGQSMPLPPTLDQHRQESIKWIEENSSEVALLIHPLEAKFLTWFARLLGVKKVLEIGCLTGCSTLHFAEALKDIPGSEIISLDLPGKHSDFANACFQKYAPRPDPKITLIEGKAIESLQKLVGKQFDLILFDADKPMFPTYLDIIMNLDLLPPGGMLVVDNVLRYGLVPDPNSSSLYGEGITFGTEKVDRLNSKISGDPRFENIILPVFDGLNFVRRKY